MDEQAKIKLCNSGHFVFLFAYIYFGFIAVTVEKGYIHWDSGYEKISLLIFVAVIFFGILGVFFLVPDIIKGVITRCKILYRIIRSQFPLANGVNNFKSTFIRAIKFYSQKVDKYYDIYNAEASLHLRNYNINNSNNTIYNIQNTYKCFSQFLREQNEDKFNSKSNLNLNQEILKAEQKRLKEKENLINQSLDYTIKEFSAFLTKTEVDLIQKAFHHFLVGKEFRLDYKISICERVGKYDIYNYGWSIWNHLKRLDIGSVAVAEFLIKVFDLIDNPTEKSIVSNWTKRASIPKMSLTKDITAYLLDKDNY